MKGFFKKLKQTFFAPFASPAAKAASSRPSKSKVQKKKPKPQSVQRKARPPKKKISAKNSNPQRFKGPTKSSKTKGAPRTKKKAAVKPVPKKQTPAGTLIGDVTHFFPQVNAAAIRIHSGTLQVGDALYIKGATTDFKIKISSMQINRVPVTSASKGSEIGILSKKRVREGDQVYKL